MPALQSITPNIEPFAFQSHAGRVIFGRGEFSRLGELAEAQGIGRALVVSTSGRKGLAERAAGQLGDKCAAIYAGAVAHTPVEATELAMQQLEVNAVDGIISIGGGSAIGLSKAIAFRTGLPQIAVPTTFSGSEMTSYLGETMDGNKITIRDEKVLPAGALYDAELTVSLRADLAAVSGLNAIAHAVEALYSPDRSPLLSRIAQDGIATLAQALPEIMVNPESIEDRSRALYGAWLCGMCLNGAGMALHHKLCHVLGGTFDLPHAETHAVILPHALTYNAAAAPEAAELVAVAIGAEDAGKGLFHLASRLGVMRGLNELGMPETGIEQVVEVVMNSRITNPRPLERQALQGLLRRAWRGVIPA